MCVNYISSVSCTGNSGSFHAIQSSSLTSYDCITSFYLLLITDTVLCLIGFSCAPYVLTLVYLDHIVLKKNTVTGGVQLAVFVQSLAFFYTPMSHHCFPALSDHRNRWFWP